MNAGGKHLRRMAVAEVMEPDSLQRRVAKHPHPFVRQGTRLQRDGVGLGDDKGLVVEPYAEAEVLLGVAHPVALQFLDHGRRDVDDARMAGLRFLVAHGAFDLFVDRA